MVSAFPAESPLSLLEQLPADVHSVAAARRAIRRFAGDLEVDLDGMVLAVSEAVANAVAHAYPDGHTGSVELAAATTPYEVTVVVRDRGQGLGAPSRPGAGFGLQIIRRLTQHVEVESQDEGVAVTMRFRRGGPWSVR